MLSRKSVLLSNFRHASPSLLGSVILASSRPCTLASFCRLKIQALTTERQNADEFTRKQEPFVITTPLYYVNAPPHMGSAYPTIAADALSRFQRLQGKKVVFITGTDEHGEKIAAAAAANGRQPKEHCDAIGQEYQSLWQDLGISYDKFIRTTDDKHEKAVAEFYQRVHKKGDIYLANYEGVYCVNCEEYKDPTELMEGKLCPIHRRPCEERKESNYFFALSKYQCQLEEFLSNNPEFVRPPFRLNEVQGWVKSGLNDFSISREAVKWGIPVPTDGKQTIYVWFDALLGYVSALLEDGQELNPSNVLGSGWPASVHIIGKDILRFHAVYWPAMLMSAGLPLPKMVFGHGFLTKDGLKMGKSLGNTIDPKDLVSRFGADAVRYFFLREIEFGKDGDFSEERFLNIVNSHLANTIGNLLHRTLGLLKKNCNSIIPVDPFSISSENPLRQVVDDGVLEAKEYFEDLHFAKACEKLIGMANAGNSYLDEQAPWSAFKKGGKSAESASQDLTVVLEVLRILAVALSPVVPNLCRRVYLQLGYSVSEYEATTWDDTRWGGLMYGQVMATPEPLFRRIGELEKVEGDVLLEAKKPDKIKVSGISTL